jgi:hypothetical protein
MHISLFLPYPIYQRRGGEARGKEKNMRKTYLAELAGLANITREGVEGGLIVSEICAGLVSAAAG